jgi:hypothetical protein
MLSICKHTHTYNNHTASSHVDTCRCSTNSHWISRKHVHANGNASTRNALHCISHARQCHTWHTVQLRHFVQSYTHHTATMHQFVHISYALTSWYRHHSRHHYSLLSSSWSPVKHICCLRTFSVKVYIHQVFPSSEIWILFALSIILYLQLTVRLSLSVLLSTYCVTVVACLLYFIIRYLVCDIEFSCRVCDALCILVLWITFFISFLLYNCWCMGHKCIYEIHNLTTLTNPLFPYTSNRYDVRPCTYQ